MKLDYILHHIINNYNDDEGVAHYDYVRSEIWFRTPELCKEIGEFLNMEIPLETNVIVSKEQMEEVHKLLVDRIDLVGSYGDWFLNTWTYNGIKD